MSKHEVIIRCDGGRIIGLGHVMRCLALADMIRDDFEISFALQKTTDEVKALIAKEGYSIHEMPATEDFKEDAVSLQKLIHSKSLVILDGYNFRSDYQKTIKDVGCKLVCIDDLHAWHHYADIVINHAGGVSEEEYDCEEYTQLLLGYEYALLRKEFLQYNKEIERNNSLSHFFISMGAGDLLGNTVKFSEALLHWPQTEKIRLMVSTLNPHLDTIVDLQNQHPDRIEVHYNVNASQLIQLIEQTHLVICPASTIALETCSVGCLLMTGTTAENQKSNLKGLVESGMAIDLGDLNTVSQQAFLIRLESVFLNPQNDGMLLRQREQLNAKTLLRIASALKNLLPRESNDLFDVRQARRDDLHIYFEWANDPEVRINSFNSDPITLEKHTAWYLENLKTNSVVMLLFLMGDEPVAQVRFRLEEGTAVLSYSIDKKNRGLGLSAPIIRKAIHELRKILPSVSTIIAEVKPENVASAKAFEKNHFEKITSSDAKIVFKLTLLN